MSHRCSLTQLLFTFLAGLGASGQTLSHLQGIVRDPSGSAVSGAEVRSIELSTSAERKAFTGDDGRFQVRNLPPGGYRVITTAPGFKTTSQPSVILTAGQTTETGVTLEIGPLSEVVEVTQPVSLLSLSAADWSSGFGSRTITKLPVNGRDLFELAGEQRASIVTNLNRSGFTGGFGLAMSLNGGRPNQNGFRMDGIQVNDVTGLPPISAAGRLLGIEGVEELSVVSSPFSAEYGRAAAAVITAVSRSGGNDWHGSVYEFFRNGVTDARNFFDSTGTRPQFHRNQFGGLISGPVVRDRLFVLVNPESLRESQSVAASVPTITAQTRQGFLPIAGIGTVPFPISPAIQPYLNLYPLPNGRDYHDGTGEYRTNVPATASEDFIAAKVDALFTPRLRSAIRATFDHASAGTADAYRWWDFNNRTHSTFVHTDTQFVSSPSMIHNFRVGVSRLWNRAVPDVSKTIPSSLSFVPGQDLGVLQVTGLEDYGSNRALITRLQIASTDTQFNYQLSWVHGSQSLQAGAGYSRLENSPTIEVNTRGYYFFYSLASFLAGQPVAANVTTPGSNPSRTFLQHLGYGFVQYENRLRPGLTLSAGLRYEPYTAPSERHGRVGTLAYPATTAVTTGGPLYRNPSATNFAPRAALAWRPWSSKPVVVRAGFGIFYDILGSTTYTGNRAYAPSQYQNVTAILPQFPNLLAAISPQLPPFLEMVDYDVQQPYLMQQQLQVEGQIAGGIHVQAGYAGTRGVHLAGYVGDINPRSSVNPAFGQVSMLRTQFNLFHHALVTGLDRRWANGFRVEAHYTFGKTIDETSSVLFQDFLNFDKIPNPYNYRANRGLSDYNVTHAFALNYSYALPYHRVNGLGRIAGGWELHGVLQAQSGRPFNPHIGFDEAGLGSLDDLGQRPNVDVKTPLILGSPDQYFNPAAFSVPAPGTFGNLGRNTLTGPEMFTMDAALHKVLWQTDRQAVVFRAEAFNVTNRANFQIPSQLALFGVDGSRVGSAGQITETSTPARRVQFALRWTF